MQADACVRACAANSRTGPGRVGESCSDCQTTSECFSPDSAENLPPAARASDGLICLLYHLHRALFDLSISFISQ